MTDWKTVYAEVPAMHVARTLLLSTEVQHFRSNARGSRGAAAQRRERQTFMEAYQSRHALFSW